MVATLQAALATLLETALHGFFTGFVPAVERRRREAGEEERSYLDMAVTTLGALVGRKNCTKVIACRSATTVFLTFIHDVFQDWETGGPEAARRCCLGHDGGEPCPTGT